MAPLRKIDTLKDLSPADQRVYGKIDVSALLKLVREWQLLYRVDHPDHGKKPRMDAVWAAIGEQLSIDGALLKFKFKQLKATYRKEESKSRRASGGPAKVWQYTAEMSEIIDSTEALRPSAGNLLRTAVKPTTSTNSDTQESSTTVIEPGVPDDDTFFSSFDHNYLETAPQAHGDFLQTLSTISKQDQDGDLLFLLSLLPYLKQLTPHQKLTFRCEMQTLLLSKLPSPEA